MSRPATKSAKHRRGRENNTSHTSPIDGGLSTRAPKRPALRWAVIAVLFLVAAATTFMLVKYLSPPPLPDQVVGTWRAVSGELAGDTVHFDRDGAFRAEVQVDGKSRTVNATVSYDGDHLHFHWTNPQTGKTEVESHKITHINSEEMILETNAGATTKMVRLR